MVRSYPHFQTTGWLSPKTGYNLHAIQPSTSRTPDRIRRRLGCDVGRRLCACSQTLTPSHRLLNQCICDAFRALLLNNNHVLYCISCTCDVFHAPFCGLIKHLYLGIGFAHVIYICISVLFSISVPRYRFRS